MLLGASELYDRVAVTIEVLEVGCWKDARQGARAAIVLDAEDPKARVREARMMILREAAIVCRVISRRDCDCVSRGDPL